MHRALPTLATTLLLLGMVAGCTASDLPPLLPHTFAGTVTLDGAPAPVGTVILVTGAFVLTGIEGNPFTLTEAGSFGLGDWDPLLMVQGPDLAEGTPLSITVNGIPAATAMYVPGDATRLTLSVSSTDPTPPVTVVPTPIPPPPAPTERVHQVFGIVLIDGYLAPVGTEVRAIGPGVCENIEGNPITLQYPGEWGGDPNEGHLLIRGTGSAPAEGTPVGIYVNGVLAKTVTFIPGMATYDVFSITDPHPDPLPDTLPHSFYGCVTLDGAPAPLGTTLRVEGDGVRAGIAGNPVTLTTAGSYGMGDDEKLLVQGDVENGTLLHFTVNGQPVNGYPQVPDSVTFMAGGATRVDLAITTLPLPPNPPGYDPTPTPTPPSPPAPTPTVTPNVTPPTPDPTPTPPVTPPEDGGYAYVAIASSPSGATMTVKDGNGNVIGSPVATPAVVEVSPAGTYTFTFVKAGYRTLNLVRSLNADEDYDFLAILRPSS